MFPHVGMQHPLVAVRCDQGMSDELCGNTETCAPESNKYSTFLCVSWTCSRFEAPTAEISCGGRQLSCFPSMCIDLCIEKSVSQNWCGTNRTRQIWDGQVVERVTMLLEEVCEQVSVGMHSELVPRDVDGHWKAAQLRLWVRDDHRLTKFHQLSWPAVEG